MGSVSSSIRAAASRRIGGSSVSPWDMHVRHKCTGSPPGPASRNSKAAAGALPASAVTAPRGTRPQRGDPPRLPPPPERAQCQKPEERRGQRTPAGRRGGGHGRRKLGAARRCLGEAQPSILLGLPPVVREPLVREPFVHPVIPHVGPLSTYGRTAVQG